MLKGAIEALREIQMANVASEVVYRRLGGESKIVKAIVGRTCFRSTDESGIWTRIETRDFVVPREQIGFKPEIGDEIFFLGNTYEVLSPAGEPAWRWSDAFHTAYRIHAKHIGG